MSSAPRRLLITGVDGFVGRHVAKEAIEAGHRVVGIARAETPDAELSALLDDYRSADLVEGMPSGLSFDAVLHLAALAAVGPSFAEPQRYLNSNSAMVTGLCESILADGRETHVVIVSSGAVYAPPTDGPLTESDPVAPTSPYVVSKLLVETQAEYYRRRGLSVVVARPFNHVGPGQRPGYLVPDLYRRLAALRDGEPLEVGRLSTRRDYLDVRDVARAYLAILGDPAAAARTYNIASGASLSGHEILGLICAAMSLPVPELAVKDDHLRPTDIPEITGSSDALRADYGWAPRIPIGDSIADFVAAASTRVQD
jgi:GDP-4-dehydro-6-deoxy-D-mannose reductase